MQTYNETPGNGKTSCSATSLITPRPHEWDVNAPYNDNHQDANNRTGIKASNDNSAPLTLSDLLTKQLNNTQLEIYEAPLSILKTQPPAGVTGPHPAAPHL